MTTASTQARIGRPRATAADSHEAILTAVYDLLQEMSVRELTMDKVAKRAGVGKPTLYRWWKSKPALVVAMFNERIVPTLDAPEGTTLEASIRLKVERLVSAFNGFFGKVISELVAEGQGDPEILRELNDGYVQSRRAGTIGEIIEAQEQGTVSKEIDPEMVVDAIFGSLYFTLLLKLRPLSPDYADRVITLSKTMLAL